MTNGTIVRPAVLAWEMSSVKHEDRLTVISWTEYARSEKDDSFISLASEVESRSESIRAQILAFVYETGNKTHRGQTLIEALKIRDSFSWWWMTLFALRRWHDHSNLYSIARIFALRHVLVDNQITNLKIADMPDDIAIGIESLCNSLRIDFQNEGRSSSFIASPRVRDRLPLIVQALAIFVRTAFISSAKDAADVKSGDGICFFDYLNGIDLEKYRNGIYVSRYWGPVVEITESLKSANSWFHLFTPSNTTPTPRIAIEKLHVSNSLPRDSHFLLSNCLNLRVLHAALLIYLRVFLTSVKSGRKYNQFVDEQTGIDFTDLLRDEWLDSLRGRTAMHHAILFCSIENRVRRLPPQKAAIFVMENQPWEMALTYAWKKFQSSKIIGVPHATAKFWELRHLVDPRSRSAIEIYKFPEPDLIGVNSPFMRDLLEDNTFPKNRIIDLEPSGFGHLASQQTKARPPTSLLEKSVLVFGDFNLDLTMSLLKATAKSLGELHTQTINIFRPHPMCAITPEILSEHGFVTNDDSISEQLEVADLVIAPSSTSAAVEAFCLGIPVVILLGAGTFNYSPLRNMDGVFFTTDEKGLGLAIASASAAGRTNPKPYFNIDSTFTRWRSLLEKLQ